MTQLPQAARGAAGAFADISEDGRRSLRDCCTAPEQGAGVHDRLRPLTADARRCRPIRHQTVWGLPLIRAGCLSNRPAFDISDRPRRGGSVSCTSARISMIAQTRRPSLPSYPSSMPDGSSVLEDLIWALGRPLWKQADEHDSAHRQESQRLRLVRTSQPPSAGSYPTPPGIGLLAADAADRMDHTTEAQSTKPLLLLLDRGRKGA